MERHVGLSLLSVGTEVSDWLMYHVFVSSQISRQSSTSRLYTSTADFRGSNVGLAGCGMGLRIEAGCGIRKKLKSGCGMKSSCRDRDTRLFHSRDAGCFEIDGGIGSSFILDNIISYSNLGNGTRFSLRVTVRGTVFALKCFRRHMLLEICLTFARNVKYCSNVAQRAKKCSRVLKMQNSVPN